MSNSDSTVDAPKWASADESILDDTLVRTWRSVNMADPAPRLEAIYIEQLVEDSGPENGLEISVWFNDGHARSVIDLADSGGLRKLAASMLAAATRVDRLLQS